MRMRASIPSGRRTVWLCHPRALIFRSYAVKELPWCTGKRIKPSTSSDQSLTAQKTSAVERTFEPIERFGLVAAMSLNRVIGVNGALPWGKLDQDRKIFTELTKNRYIILGRATFRELPDLSHICHASCCIVVSTTMSEDNLRMWENIPLELQIARSFPEALDMARRDIEQIASRADNDQGMMCWVVGGERLYNEAVMHSSLEEIHLSVVNKSIEELPDDTIRRFPPKYRWDHKFRLLDHKQYDSFHYYKYVRNRGFV